MFIEQIHKNTPAYFQSDLLGRDRSELTELEIQAYCLKLIAHGHIFFCRILIPLKSALISAAKHNDMVKLVKELYVDIDSAIKGATPLSSHEIFECLRRDYDENKGGHCRAISKSFNNIGLLDSIETNDEGKFVEILGTDSKLSCWWGAFLHLVKNQYVYHDEMLEIENLYGSGKITFEEYTALQLEADNEYKKIFPHQYHLFKAYPPSLDTALTVYKAFGSESDLISLVTSDKPEIIPFQDVLHDFRILVYEYLFNRKFLSPSENEEIIKLLSHELCQDEYQKARLDYESGVLGESIMQEVAFYENLIKPKGQASNIDVALGEKGICINMTDGHYVAIDFLEGLSSEDSDCDIVDNIDDIKVYFPKEKFGNDEKLWNVDPSISDNKKLIKKIFDMLVKFECIDCTQKNLDLLVCFLSKRKAKATIEKMVWKSSKEELCYFIRKMAGRDSRMWAKSTRLFEYPDGPFCSKSAPMDWQSTSVRQEFQNKINEIITGK